MRSARLPIAIILLTSLLAVQPSYAALEADSSDTTNACAQLVKAKGSGKSLTAVDPSTQETIDSPAYSAQISACNRNQQMCAPTKKQLGAGSPPGLACQAQAGLVRKCLLTLTLLGQLACGESSPEGEAELIHQPPTAAAGPNPTN